MTYIVPVIMRPSVIIAIIAALAGCMRSEPYKDRVSADFDLDGKMDTVFIQQEGRNTTLRIDDMQIALFPYDQEIYGIEVEDMNDDGRPDIYVIWKQRGREAGMFLGKINFYNISRGVFSETEP